MRKMHRLPNGFGSIKKLSGVRRNPYGAYPPCTAYYENGAPKPAKAIGYYPTYNAAFKALTEWNAEPFHTEKITFDACCALFFEHKFNGKRKYSDSMKSSMKAAYGNCKPIHNKLMEDITPAELQRLVDSCPLKRSSVELVVHLLKSVWKFAEQNDYVRKDCAKYLKINIPEDDEHGVPFSDQEIEILWQHTDDPVCISALSMIYSGFRVSALKTWEINMNDQTIYGGVKTGKRTVPIHPAILPFVSKAHSYLAKDFREGLSVYGINSHTPHDCRHTFSWLCDRYNVDSISKHMLMGHALGKDVEAKVYSHRTMDELRTEIEKICC